jgi:hypothetical protein
VSRGVFRHAEALDGACDECHGGLFDEDADFVEARSRSDVLAMREKAHDSGRSCETCHATLRADVAPSSHRQSWKRRHGLFAREDEALCGTCHMEEGCRECHQEETPSSHSNLWRLSTHGLEASWGRESCQTCHQEDFCVACHRETRPRSHNGAWERRHGFQASWGQASCQTCHQVDFCTSCHSSDSGEPRSHRAAWQRRHCFQCHISAGPASGCEICHVARIGPSHDNLIPANHPFDITQVEPGAWCSSIDCHPTLWTRHAFTDEGECRRCHG